MAKSKTKDDLFGFNPLVLLGAAVGGIALLSWIGETPTKSKGCGCGCSKDKNGLDTVVPDEGLGMIAGPKCLAFINGNTGLYTRCCPNPNGSWSCCDTVNGCGTGDPGQHPKDW